MPRVFEMVKLIAKEIDFATAAEELRRAGIYLSKKDCPVATVVLLQLRDLERAAGTIIKQEIDDGCWLNSQKVEIEIENPHHVFLIRMALDMLQRGYHIVPKKENNAGAK